MENTNRCITKANNTIDQSPEESGWTMYLEDSLLQNDNDIHSHCSLDNISGYDESSLISDAGSSVNASKKLGNHNDNQGISLRFGMNWDKGNYYCNRLSFKKRKTIDDTLEDTASSPLNSPKVFNLNQKGVKPKEKDDNQNRMFDQDKGIIRNSGGKDEQRSHVRLDGFTCREETDCTELKKRGLCLVPLSMIMNYIG